MPAFFSSPSLPAIESISLKGLITYEYGLIKTATTLIMAILLMFYNQISALYLILLYLFNFSFSFSIKWKIINIVFLSTKYAMDSH